MMIRSIPAIFIRLILLGTGLFALSAQAAENAKFYRGVNLNGPPLTIDGHAWEGDKGAKNLSVSGNSFENQAVQLKPATEAERAKMIRSSRWGSKVDVEFSGVPEGAYQIYLYVWEDNHSEKFNILIHDKIVLEGFHSGSAGMWRKLGPYDARSLGGKLKISARGPSHGAANLSGVEIWAGDGPIPNVAGNQFVTTPTADQVEFFERKVRPLLADRCYECHSAGAKKIGAGLLLDSRAGIIKGGDTGPVIAPGDPEASLLIRAVRHVDVNLTMPQKPRKKLSTIEIADLEAWIRMGAPDPRLADTVAATQAKYAIDWNKARQWWSFRPLGADGPPSVKQSDWPADEIDRFILARLEREGLKPAGDADRRTLIRRATFDLIGLPPTPQEVEAFIADASPDAFEKVVDRLLKSPHYGERWGRHWLDVVRYADTAGDNSDFPIPQMYRYRNWVIDAFNQDMPYDQFIRQQLAGDLMRGGTQSERNERLIATGYIAGARRFGSRVEDYPQHLTIEDTLDNLGRAFMGLTINCARCHDHKFDPVTTADYYALYGVFHSTRYPWPGIELEQKQRDLVPLVPEQEAQAARKNHQEKQRKLDDEVKRLKKEADAATGDMKKAAKQAFEAAKKAAEQHKAQPPNFELAYAVAEASKIEDVAIQIKGDPSKPGSVVRRRFLTVLGGSELPQEDKGSGRLALADWIVDRENPLTARVMVNRIWLHHFGKGIVPTPNDFGRQGKAPTHPELLDWLARRFIESGWSIKSMHRRITLSRTYRMAGSGDAGPATGDPNNELLGSFPRRRLDAEAIRDSLLALGGNLDRSPPGPHPFPAQSEWKFTQHNPFKAVYESNRRSVYLMTQRIQRHPYLAIFDGADPAASTPARLTSTTPLQALFLLNDPFVHEQSNRLAARLIAESKDDLQRLTLGYQLALARPPRPDELAVGRAFLAAARDKLRSDSKDQAQLETESWRAMVRVLFRLNEFVYID